MKLARARCTRLADTCPWALRLRRLRYWLGWEWDPDGEGCRNAEDRRNHMMILDQLRISVPRDSGGAFDMATMRRVAKSVRESMLEQLEECMAFSPRDPDFPALIAALRASLRDDADKLGGTATKDRKGVAMERDDPSSSRADRKRRGRR